MVHYKLTYFNFRGFGEAARQIFHLAGVEFEDIRITHGDPSWAKLKEEVPFGQIPILSVDGFEIPQSAAIIRYLARKFGYAGKTPEEEAWVDAIVDQFKDFIAVFRAYIAAGFLNKPVEELDRIRRDISQPACDEWLKTITGVLEESKSGYLVGDSLTFADLVVADNLVTLRVHGFMKNEDYPILAKHQAKIHNLPKLKEWIAIRPPTYNQL